LTPFWPAGLLQMSKRGRLRPGCGASTGFAGEGSYAGRGISLGEKLRSFFGVSSIVWSCFARHVKAPGLDGAVSVVSVASFLNSSANPWQNAFSTPAS